MTTFEKSAAIVALIVAFLVPFLFDAYYIRVAATALYFVILASSWNLLLGYAGVLSFGHAAFAAIGAYTSGLLCLYLNVPPILGVVAGGLLAAAVGWALARMCLRLRGPYLALMTIGFSEILRLVLQIEHEFTRGSLGLEMPYLLGTDGPNHALGYAVMLAMTLISLFVIYRLVNSEAGLYLKAIREDEDVAMAMGIDTVKWKVNAFVISSLMAGLAGGLFAHLFVQVIAPQMILLSEMGLILAMTIVGGLGTLAGPVIGAVLLVFGQEQLREISPHAHLLIFAILVILVMKFFRRGLFGLIQDRLRSRKLITTVPPITRPVD